MTDPKPEILPTVDNNCCDAKPSQAQVSCCGSTAKPIRPVSDRYWRNGSVSTKIGEIPRVTTRLTWRDRLGHWKVRWGIGRMRYAVAPGLYAVGNPASESHVFVTANFKMSFDHLRVSLDARDGWILVLDTKGINVWCAAGKGTFGTEELVKRIFISRLSELVTHRKLIAPQLGAPGVAAHEVRKATGFTVRYGPVRAADIPVFIDSDMKASPEMRRVKFPVRDRLALAPVELLQWVKWGTLIAIALGLLAGFGRDIFSVERALWNMLRAVVPVFTGLIAGAVITPWLLPWLPGRAFAAKGAWAGVLTWAILMTCLLYFSPGSHGWIDQIAWALIVLAGASFVGMNFTGASTYTSLSGVRKEMRTAVPIQAGVAAVGIGFWMVGRFL